MATEAQLIEGLRAADAAGNHDDAQHFADEIKALRSFDSAGGKPTPPEPAPSKLLDIARSIPGGLVKGAAATAGIPGSISDALSGGLDYVANSVTGANINTGNNPLSGQNIAEFVAKPTGGYYQPKTVPGSYAETIASFLPAAAAPGSIPARIARTVIPATTSETAGQFTAGTSAEPYARVAGGLLGGVAAGPSVRSINSLTSRLGVPIENPNIAANSMMADAVRRDGGPGAVTTSLNDWRGASNPALIDVTGNNVRRLVRSAASGGNGEAQNVATAYVDRVAGNTQDSALQLTRGLTPNAPQSATQYGEELATAQSNDAAANYRGPYSQPANVTPEMVSALQGPEGRGAINRAFAAARANRNSQQMAELQDLQGVATEQGGGADPLTGRRRSVQQALGELSAGSLDRVRIAMRETGGNLAARGARDMARGYRGRVADIDTALDQTPGLGEARASYRNYARQQDALELGQSGLNASPEDYGATILRLGSGADPQAVQQAAGVGYRQSLTDAISSPAEGATGVLNRIATSDANTRNLSATFGQHAAQDYQTGVGNEISRVRNSRFISPNTGSQTELRAQDSALLDIPHSTAGLVARVWDKIKSGAQLTEQERTALVRLGTTEARLVQLQRANPSVTSRAATAALLSQTPQRQ